jgi:hypothetical protein
MRAFILQHRQDYLRKGRMTKRERDDLEQEVGLFVKTCRQRIEVLKDVVTSEAPAKQTLAWIGGQGRDSNTNLVAHWHGVVRAPSGSVLSLLPCLSSRSKCSGREHTRSGNCFAVSRSK